jgi:hypothetical protein
VLSFIGGVSRTPQILWHCRAVERSGMIELAASDLAGQIRWPCLQLTPAIVRRSLLCGLPLAV